MSTALIIVIVIAAIILVAVAAVLIRRRAAERELERRRLAGEASAHRDQAESNVSRARELGRDAELHRRQAEEHAAAAEEHAAAADEHAERATGLDRKVQTAGKAAARHDEQAAEREQKLS
jgi:hypothetical protein